MIFVKRVYEKPSEGDGIRILVDRLWPRGLTKEKARVNLWLKELGPSDSLRRWFNHEDEKWNEFKKRYFGELKQKSDLLQTIREHKRTVTLLFGAKNEKHNNAVALKEFLESN